MVRLLPKTAGGSIKSIGPAEEIQSCFDGTRTSFGEKVVFLSRLDLDKSKIQSL